MDPHLASDDEIKRFASYELDFLNVAITIFQSQEEELPAFSALTPDQLDILINQMTEVYKKRFEEATMAEAIAFFSWLFMKCIAIESCSISDGGKSPLGEYLSESLRYAGFIEDPDLYRQSVKKD